MNHEQRLKLIHAPYPITYMGGRGTYPWAGMQVGLTSGSAYLIADISGGHRASAVLTVRTHFDGSWDNVIDREETRWDDEEAA